MIIILSCKQDKHQSSSAINNLMKFKIATVLSQILFLATVVAHSAERNECAQLISRNTRKFIKALSRVESSGPTRDGHVKFERENDFDRRRTRMRTKKRLLGGRGGVGGGATTKRRDFGEAQQIVLINERGQSTKRFCMAVNQRRRRFAVWGSRREP